METDLVFKLALANFPFNPHRDWKSSKYVMNPFPETLRQTLIKLYIPSLEELIEACGDGLQDLTHTDDGWITNAENIGDLIQTNGKTPLQAVAYLWLALNRKS